MNLLASDRRASWTTLQRRALLLGAACAVLCAIGAVFDLTQFLRSYLIAFTFWLGIPLGCLAVWMIHHLTGGAWGLALRPLLQAGSQTLVLFVLLFVPIALGVEHIYPWAESGAADDPELRHKIESYLNVPFFLIRSAIYLAVWVAVMLLVNYWNAAWERTGDPKLARRAQVFSGPGLALSGLALTFASIDWIMSLEPHWYSTIFGMLIGTEQVLAGFAFAVFILTRLTVHEPAAAQVGADVWNDLGNLLLAFVMLWTYMSFSQLLLIWSGNLPEEITWYLHRSQGGWQLVAVLLAVFYFAVPFLCLLGRGVKRTPLRLGNLALVLLVMSGVHQFWLIAPAFEARTRVVHEDSPGRFRLHWLDAAAFLAVGGIWIAFFCSRMRGRTLTPAAAVEDAKEAAHA